MLIGSNVIDYGAKLENGTLRQWIAEKAPAVSVVSYVEVFGEHPLTPDDKKHLEEFVAVATILPIADRVFKEAILLRQAKKMSPGDSMVAGTTLASKHVLATRNTKDFAWIAGWTVMDPWDGLSTKARPNAASSAGR